MGRSPCCSKVGMNKGAWSSDEDKILTDYIQTNGVGGWRELPKKAGLNRCGKSCRLRWMNYLRPNIKRGNIAEDEEELIIKLHKLLGNRWSLIAGRLPGRTDNEIKNYWNTHLGRRAESSTQENLPHSCKMKHQKESSNETATSRDVPSVKAVRTKAHRCTKAFLTLQPEEVASDHYKKRVTPLHHDNFLLDIDAGDLCLSDVVGSDLDQLSYFHEDTKQFASDYENISTNELPSSPDIHLFSSVEDWLCD